MKYPNRISVAIPKSDLKEILGAINFIQEKLPNLVSLSSRELSALPKTSGSTIEFILENLRLADKYPKLVPANIAIDEIQKDVHLINDLNKILKPLKDLVKKLEDSATLAGSEAYLPSIAIYNAIKADAIRKKHSKSSLSV